MATEEDRDSSHASASPLGVRQWTTADVPPPERLDYWLHAICQGLDEHEVTSAAGTDFHATLESAGCGQIMVNTVESTPQDVHRTKAAISRSDESRFYLRCTLDAPWAAAQNNGVSRLMPGDCMLFDSKQPYEMHFESAANLITLRLPVDWIESWLTDPQAQCGLRIDAAGGWGQPLSSFVQQLTPQVATRPPLPTKLLTDQLGSLLALGTNDFAGHANESSRTMDAFIRKATERLHQRYAEHGLTAQAIAKDLFISERTLHRYFARSGATFLQHLIRHRMTVAERMLRDPRFDRITVSEVGRRIGLADTSHFIRQCRATLGMTPAALRSAR
ncbi:helix-turn-helix domain-containing protein [Variovorax sp. J22P168]|uniref:AraC-like ligand-binding domain-containing protein n=1 Tax=Variovorax jilinensis TaxID=3053513 RepID=UPI0025752B82|nr:helix-turn-helix domain-containing protein [Variovorax sp. J22P168]MDM0015076.1 helix-turn-helix domain-containing protein [Variovorax sp. J22P168]